MKTWIIVLSIVSALLLTGGVILFIQLNKEKKKNADKKADQPKQTPAQQAATGSTASASTTPASGRVMG